VSPPILKTDWRHWYAKFELRSFTRSWDNRGYAKKLGSHWIRPCSPSLNISNGFLFGWMDPMNVLATISHEIVYHSPQYRQTYKPTRWVQSARWKMTQAQHGKPYVYIVLLRLRHSLQPIQL